MGFFSISHLRGDSLGQILTYGNVRSGITVGVVDSCQGLVMGAVLERMGGEYSSFPNSNTVL